MKQMRLPMVAPVRPRMVSTEERNRSRDDLHKSPAGMVISQEGGFAVALFKY